MGEADGSHGPLWTIWKDQETPVNARNQIANWLHSARAEIARNLETFKVKLEDHTVCYQLFLFGQSKKLLAEDQLLEHLIKDSLFPAVIDIAPTAILGDRLILAVMPTGHAWVSKGEQTWGGMERGPFKPCPWSLPDSVVKGSSPTVESFLENGRLLKNELY